MEREFYAMYLRKSRADEEAEARGQFETLAKHEADLTELCERGGYVVARVYKELASGESVSARPEFRALMEEVAQRKYRGIVVHATDRLGRGDPMEYGWILSTLKYTNTLIVTMGRTYDPNDPSDMQLLQIQMFVSQYELENTKRRLRDGVERKVKDGCYVASHAPFGYDKCVNAFKQKTLVPNENAPTVRAVFEEVAAGGTADSVSTLMNRRGTPSPRGGVWTAPLVKYMIANPAYKGCVRWNNTVSEAVTRDGMQVVRRKVRNDEPIVVKGLHEAIVPEGLWDAANARLRPSTRVRDEFELKNPLAGLLVCSKCGRAMVHHLAYSKGKRYRRYQHYRFGECSARSTNAENVIALVAEGLAEIAENIECDVEGDDEAARMEAEKEGLKRSMAAERRKVDKLIELYAADAITMQEFVERKGPATARVEEMAARLEELDSYVPRDREAVRLNVRDALKAMGDPGASAEDVNAALKRFVERIEYTNETEHQNDQRIRLKIVLK